ncbi:MAG: fucose isomerase [Treponemataceae bacterium]|jgi:L-fucose mutarotase|nr:fucose isomerase [Treponemataceae bacterium]
MLKGIPSIISPELLKILMEMGHGDEIIIADGNFPGASLANKLVRLDGHTGPEVLEAVLKLLPLDTYADNFVLMQKMECDKNMEIPVWKDYERIAAAGDKGFSKLTYIDRFEFYERAKKAYAIIATSETAQYANILLKKGLVLEK